MEAGPDKTPHRHLPRPDAGVAADTSAVFGSDDVVPIREVVRPWTLDVLVTAYGGDTYRLLTDLADLLQASIAHVDRPTVEAHRQATSANWPSTAGATPANP